MLQLKLNLGYERTFHDVNSNRKKCHWRKIWRRQRDVFQRCNIPLPPFPLRTLENKMFIRSSNQYGWERTLEYLWLQGVWTSLMLCLRSAWTVKNAAINSHDTEWIIGIFRSRWRATIFACANFEFAVCFFRSNFSFVMNRSGQYLVC